MTGRGVDQILEHPSDPVLHEPAMDDAGAYVTLAESVNGVIPRRALAAYLWGDALEELARLEPDARVINLETSVTRSDSPWRGKDIHYRMHPANIGCLTAARIDVATLANNHVLDWGRAGLLETITTLTNAGIKVAGAGTNIGRAREPASVDLKGGGRLLVFAFGSPTSGVAADWAATNDRPGVEVVEDLSGTAATAIGNRMRLARRPGDLIIASIHWGSNWGYDVPESFVAFAHQLIEEGVDLIHGHSSHHVRPIEVYRERLILYGCGDFINDYEGISGYEEFRDDLAVMYFATLAASGALLELRMVPMQIRKFSLRRPPPADGRWLQGTIAKISAAFGSSVEAAADGSFLLRWKGST